MGGVVGRERERRGRGGEESARFFFRPFETKHLKPNTAHAPPLHPTTPIHQVLTRVTALAAKVPILGGVAAKGERWSGGGALLKGERKKKRTVAEFATNPAFSPAALSNLSLPLTNLPSLPSPHTHAL